MSIFSKLRLFRKKDEFADLKLDTSLDKGFKQPDFQPDPFDQARFPQQQGFQAFDNQKNFSVEQDVKLISSKIDTLIAKMDNMNQRIANLERIASESQR